jgi:uncharacterized protein (DUF488 family)
MTKLYTIGFTKKTARQFFELLKKHDVKKIIDIRISNSSQLAGFAKGVDLEYFASEICGMGYAHILDFAPTKELLSDYQNKKIDWDEYKKVYRSIIIERQVLQKYCMEDFDNACFLCSEPTEEHCHRKLLVDFFKEKYSDIIICHIR